MKLAAFIAKAKCSPALKSINWNDVEWKLDASDPIVEKQRSHKSYGSSLAFTTRDTSGRGQMRVRASERTAIASPYADFAKADVRLHAEANNVSISVLRRDLTAHQFLERELRRTGETNSIDQLTIRHFEFAEESIAKEQAPSTAYRISQQLVRISKVIDERRLTARPIGYETRLKRPLDGDELTEEGQAEGMKKMISQEALDKLAEIFANPGSDYERLIISIVGLFVVGGFRAGEVLTIPVDCWQHQLQQGDSLDPKTGVILGNHGILYAAEKAQDYRIKWLPKDAVEMARRCVDDLTRLCQLARETAAWMEASPGRLKPFADLEPTDWISGHEACERLGFAKQTHVNWKIFRENRATVGRAGRAAWYRVGDIEQWFNSNSVIDPVMTMPSGRTQRLSETLVVVFRNQFHGNRPALSFIPELMTHSVLSGEISPAPSQEGDRIGILSRHGLRVTTKQFRHWLNTLADRGGLNGIELAKWMGRLEISQNAAYKHGTLAIRTEAAQSVIRAGDAEGTIPRIYRSLPPADREAFLKASITAAHAMSFGMCVHNFAQSPCPNCNQCLRKCPEYIRIKGDMEQRQALLEMKALEERNLQRAQAALCDSDGKGGYYGADRWVTWSKETLAGIDEALAVDDDDAISSGSQTRVFEETRQIGD
ncbi:hypothetical protein [Opitutus terrae]|uniref:hypothetical protein n=1 Tax=Opitutus terrae TaxID=107709 RepID=UPI0011D137BB|nr:hypothetical protein [Opitutus terrae]